jgi:hypothetical protein
MDKLKINLNFEELDKLPAEQYNKLESKYLEYLTKLVTSTEEDYCKKKGVSRKEILKNYETYSKMRNAVNQRKNIKEATKTCMMFNRVLRNVLQLNLMEGDNSSQA